MECDIFRNVHICWLVKNSILNHHEKTIMFQDNRKIWFNGSLFHFFSLFIFLHVHDVLDFKPQFWTHLVKEWNVMYSKIFILLKLQVLGATVKIIEYDTFSNVHFGFAYQRNQLNEHFRMLYEYSSAFFFFPLLAWHFIYDTNF